MKITFPYKNTPSLEIPPEYDIQHFDMPEFTNAFGELEVVNHAVKNPIGSKQLRELAEGKKKVLIVADDISRPTPIYRFIHTVLKELFKGGVKKSQIEILMALGTHRPMTNDEMADKLGRDITENYTIHNHNWEDESCLEYVGDTAQGVPVWINKLVTQADLVIGLGAIMPIEVAGFTGGGKIVVPGVSGQITVDQMHWTRIDIPCSQVLGQADNPIRKSIDSLARKAGLDFIVNVILDAENKIVGSVAGDMVDAHRRGCEIAKKVFGINFSKEYDIVIADSYPFDIEFWQANKGLDNAGQVVKKGGVIILVSPCYEGLSRTHPEILQHGYQSLDEIKKRVNSGCIKHKVVGVHMYQVSSVIKEKARLILVSSGISESEAKQVGFDWAKTPQQAFEKALELVKPNPSIAVIKGAARMLAIVNEEGTQNGTQK